MKTSKRGKASFLSLTVGLPVLVASSLVAGCSSPKPVVVARPTFPPPGTVLVAQPAPPAARVEVPGTPPSESHVWIQGYWAYGKNGYTWIPGHWDVRPAAAATWVPGQWSRKGDGWLWTPGYWK